MEMMMMISSPYRRIRFQLLREERNVPSTEGLLYLHRIVSGEELGIQRASVITLLKSS